ncbi:hypothetical protein [Bacillus infantis]|uniref:hypothetical protein n=1 Tax=Bacillus infantis TaxID=324767 RepID=UPI003CEC1648
MTIIGLDAFGINAFKSYSPPVRNIKYMELKNAVYDEVHVRESTDNIDSSPTKEEWQMDTLLLAQFLGDLEAGNINNRGVRIDKFAIKRRKVTETNSLTLGYKDFVNNNQFVYEDYTQSNDEFIYSIVPVGENGLEGQQTSIDMKSEFSGWFLVDAEVNEVLAFDQFIGGGGSVDTTLNQSKAQINTLTRYPRFVYTGQEYHSLQLKATFIPQEWQRSGQQYEAILEQFVRSHKPFLVKGGSGEVYVVNVDSPAKSAPQNTHKGYDYFELTLELNEIMSYEEYMELMKG